MAKKTRSECMLQIQQAIVEANRNGYDVVVASDEEGNDWNTIHPYRMFFNSEEVKKGFIPLAVERSVDESEIFETKHLDTYE